jgi:hypothetical protein
VAYYDVERVKQAKHEAEEKHAARLDTQACVQIVTECIKKSAAARVNNIKTKVKVDYSEIYNQSINSTFFGNPLPAKQFSVYRCFLGFYFASFKVRKVKPKGKKIHRPMKQAELFS